METKDLDARIKKLKEQVAGKKKEGADGKSAGGLRETRKKLKRAQRRKNTMVTRAAYIETKSQKKKKEGEVKAPTA